MLKAAIAALALPVSGFVIGKVVGDYFVYPNPWMTRVGVATGLLVYVFTLMASYKHLRNFFHAFEQENVRASHALAIAVEVATFYMSVSAVIMGSVWAFWGGILGAFVVFWGNFQSMQAAQRGNEREPWYTRRRQGRSRNAAVTAQDVTGALAGGRRGIESR